MYCTAPLSPRKGRLISFHDDDDDDDDDCVGRSERPTQPSIIPGSVNEYQLRLGRQKAGMVHSVS